MPPQIERAISSNENDKTEQFSLEDPYTSTSNTRKYLLSLLSIQWFIFVVTLGIGIYAVFLDNSVEATSDEIKSLLPLIGLVLCYTFGLLVTYKQHRVGLLLFASIGILILIAACLLLGYILFAAVGFSVRFGIANQTSEFLVFFSILFLCVIVVGVLTLKLSFDLARSIKGNDYTTV